MAKMLYYRVAKKVSDKFHQGAITSKFFGVFCRQSRLKLVKGDPTFSSFNSCPSFSPVTSDDKKHSHGLDTVLNNKTAPLFLEFNRGKKHFRFLKRQQIS